MFLFLRARVGVKVRVRVWVMVRVWVRSRVMDGVSVAQKSLELQASELGGVRVRVRVRITVMFRNGAGLGCC